MRFIQFLIILLLVSSLGACATRQESGDTTELSAQYMSQLERQSRNGFTTVQWVHPPTNAQVAQRIGRKDDD